MRAHHTKFNKTPNQKKLTIHQNNCYTL